MTLLDTAPVTAKADVPLPVLSPREAAPPAPTPAAAAEPAVYRWRWAALIVIILGSVMEMLDAMITNIAGPSMRAELGGSASTIQWFAAAYTLATTAGLLTGGRLGDIYGRRRMFVIGVAGFTVGSLLCAFAQSPEMLIVARVAQGLFGAAMIPQGLGMIKQMFPPKEMQAAFTMFGPIMGLSAVGGPILAGWLVDADFFGSGWRMIFLINLPIGVAALVGALRFLPESRSDHPLRLDIPGVALASVAALLLIFPLVQGRELGWPVWTYGMVAASAALFAIFWRYESRKGQAGGDPLVMPSLFRKRAFTGGLLAGMMLFASMAGFGLVLNLYAQLGLGYSPLKAGLTGAPYAIGMVIGMSTLQPLQRFGRRVFHAGAVISIAGVVGVIVTVHAAGTGLTPWQLAPAVAVTGIGSALLMGPYFDFVLAGVEPQETGSAAGTLTAVQQLGGAFGVALLGTILLGSVDGHAAQLGGAMQTTLWAAAGLLATAFVVGFLLPKRTGDAEYGAH